MPIKIRKSNITQKQLRKLVCYDPLTGFFTWRRRTDGSIGAARFNGRFAGKRADTKRDDGYLRIRLSIRGGLLENVAHRLAWIYVNGSTISEDCEIDHINRNRADNRISNLRLATHGQNCCNASIRRNNRSGYKGVVNVSRINASRPWKAAITINRKTKHLGYFASRTEAHVAYKAIYGRIRREFATFE